MDSIVRKPQSKILLKSLTRKPIEKPLRLLTAVDSKEFFELADVFKATESLFGFNAARKATESDIEHLEKISRDRENLKENRKDAKTAASILFFSVRQHHTPVK